jgi:hypothetical protein
MPDFDPKTGQQRGITQMTPDQIRGAPKISYRVPPANCDPREELPDRIAHRRRIAANLNASTCEHAVDDPSRRSATPNGAHKSSGPGALDSKRPVDRGPHI